MRTRLTFYVYCLLCVVMFYIWFLKSTYLNTSYGLVNTLREPVVRGAVTVTALTKSLIGRYQQCIEALSFVLHTLHCSHANFGNEWRVEIKEKEK